MFVSNGNSVNTYNIASNLTPTYKIFSNPQNYYSVNSIYPYGQPNNGTIIINQNPNMRNAQVFQTQIQKPNPSPINQTIYNITSTMQANNVNQPQYYKSIFPNTGITHNSIQATVSSQNPYSLQSIQNINNYSLSSQNPGFNIQSNIIQLPSVTVQNVANVKPIIKNYNQSQIQPQPQTQIHINSINPLNQNYNILSINQQIPQNYTIFSNKNIIDPKIHTVQVNSISSYYPNQIPSISSINYQQPPIQSIQPNQIISHFPQQNNNNINIGPMLNNKIPYNTESYEPDAENTNFPSNTTTTTTFNNIQPNITTSIINPIPTNTTTITTLNNIQPNITTSIIPIPTRTTITKLNNIQPNITTLIKSILTNTNVYNATQTFNQVNQVRTTVISPIKKTIITPIKKTVVIPSKTTVVLPKVQSIIPMDTVTTTPIKQSIITNYRPVLNNTLTQSRSKLIPITRSISPLNTYNSRTLNVVTRPLSNINTYTRRATLTKNNSVIVPLRHQRAISTSTFRAFSPLQNNLKLRPTIIGNLPLRRIVYNPRSFKYAI